MDYEPIDANTDAVAKQVVDSAYKVHRALGPGLLESVYEACLAHELQRRGLNVERQLAVPVQYEDLSVDLGLRLDLLIDQAVVVELKAVEHVLPVHKAQLLTYLKLSGCRLGLLINFNVAVIKDGIQRLIR